MRAKLVCVLFGVLIGGVLGVGVPSVLAEQGRSSGRQQFTECFATNIATVSGRDLNRGEMPRTLVQIPSGWTPIGGSGIYMNNPTVVLCR